MRVKLNGHKKRDPTTGLDDGKAVAALMKPFYVQLLKDAFGDAADAGIAVAFDLENEFVQGVLGSLAKKVKGVAETTKDEVAALVGRAAELGWSNEQLAKEIRAKGEIASRSRAILVARTESAAAFTQGSLAAFKTSGVVSQVSWLIGPDSCPECTALDGVVVGLGEEFAPGVTGPPYHPACTCVLQPVLE